MDAPRRTDTIRLALILLLAAALRVPGLGHDSFWHDEMLTLDVVRGSFAGVVGRVIETENMPPGYYLLLQPWVALFGTSEFALRLPSALCGVAAVGAVSILGARLFGTVAGQIAGLLLAVNPYHVAYSMEARGYGLMFLLAALSCHLFVTLNRSGGGRTMALYVLTSAAMLWTHPMSAFVLVAQNLFFLIAKLRYKDWTSLSVRHWLAMQGAIACLFGPWVPRLLEVGRAGQPWMTYVSMHLSLLIQARTIAILFLWFTLAGVAIWKGFGDRRVPQVLLALLLWLIPIVLPTLLSTHRKPLFTPRYGIAALIGVTVLAGYGISALGRVFGTIVTVVFVMASILALGNPLHPATMDRKPQLREAARDVAARAAEGDGVLFTWVHDARAFDHYYKGPPLERLNTLASERSPRRVWVLARPGTEPASISTYTPQDRRSYPGIDVLRLDRSD